MKQIPLYPRGKLLKNLLADWKKRTGNNTILISNIEQYDWVSDNVVEGFKPDNQLYQSTIDYWYFSEIGFDVDDVFIKRFNDIFYSNINRFTYLLQAIEDKGYSWEQLTRHGTLARSGKDTDKETGSRSYNQTKSGQDVMRKGVTTTSTQSTENVGNKLTRNTPNEELGVTGSSDTTVTDSGEDTTVYGGVTQTTETPNVNKEKTYDSTFANDVVETHEKLSTEEFMLIQSMQSIYKKFALLFENLFMEVL